MQSCANPDCSEVGKCKCSACGTVTYCGQGILIELGFSQYIVVYVA
jgi:hypothetical protein